MNEEPETESVEETVAEVLQGWQDWQTSICIDFSAFPSLSNLVNFVVVSRWSYHHTTSYESTKNPRVTWISSRTSVCWITVDGVYSQGQGWEIMYETKWRLVISRTKFVTLAYILRSLFLQCLFRRLSRNIVLPMSLRSDRAFSLLSKRRPRSTRYWSVPSIVLVIWSSMLRVRDLVQNLLGRNPKYVYMSISLCHFNSLCPATVKQFTSSWVYRDSGFFIRFTSRRVPQAINAA